MSAFSKLLPETSTQDHTELHLPTSCSRLAVETGVTAIGFCVVVEVSVTACIFEASVNLDTIIDNRCTCGKDKVSFFTLLTLYISLHLTVVVLFLHTISTLILSAAEAEIVILPKAETAIAAVHKTAFAS